MIQTVDKTAGLRAVVELPRVARLCGAQAITVASDVERVNSDDLRLPYGADSAEGHVIRHVIGHRVAGGYIIEETLCGLGTAELPDSGTWGEGGSESAGLRCSRCLELAPLEPRRTRRPMRWPRPRRHDPEWWVYPPAKTRFDLMVAFALSCLCLVPPLVLLIAWSWRLSTYFGPDGITINRWIKQERIPWSSVQGFAAGVKGLKIVVLTANGRIELPIPEESRPVGQEGLSLMVMRLNAAFGFHHIDTGQTLG